MLTSRRLAVRHLDTDFGMSARKFGCCDDDVNSMHRSMCWVLLVAQAFALCPVQGITGRRAEELRFTWRSVRVFYTSIVILALLVSLGFSFTWFLVVGFTFPASGALMFYGTGLTCCALFLNLGTKWPELALLWQRTENSQIRYGYPTNLSLKIRTLTVIILTLALVEYLLSNANRMYIASQCSTGGFDLVRRYIMVTHRHVFEVVGYSSGMAVFTAVVSIIASFYWSYADVFVMLISIALASRFKLLNSCLKKVKGKMMPEGFWRSVREDYNDLSHLTSCVDSRVSSIVLLCFATNLFYICQQLLNSMNNSVSTIQATYFYLSFGYLLLRTMAMALSAASIYDESRAAKDVLYAVPAHNYQVEVHRFLVQVSTDNISLTGLNFFPVTRTVLLTLAGTIVTYEIVLVQFGTTSDSSASNMTALCLDMTTDPYL
ncbi:gustatory receptor for sugar taste 64f isoform X1 [Cryptotermes secundus]|uniref:gustatory receptor for sugar taste 64f isoform X1 n=1 Tax=Cryptotermes secundus TaxID=105785 RepID=UPI000CD7D83C|nr:gustatory receptor for sugar taste 64f isoform X1 [Cryptotermes secundus]XP_023720514.1 gustatory receptor for sugar taste 64f isoform X1 [Cryptotermes secundus]